MTTLPLHALHHTTNLGRNRLFRPTRKDPRIRPLPTSMPRGFFLLVGAALLLLAYTMAKISAHVYTDYLWFQSLGYGSTFKTIALARFGSFLFFGLLFLAIATPNLAIARRFGQRTREMPLEVLVGDDMPPSGLLRFQRQRVAWAAVLLTGATIMGIAGTASWTAVLKYFNPTTFGVKDPIFGHDVSLYVFRLPLLNFLYFWLIATLILTAILIIVSYNRDRSIRHEDETWQTTPFVRSHLSGLGAGFAVILGLGYWIKGYELLYSFRKSAFFGAGYTDVNAQLLAYRLMILLSFALAGLLVYNLRYKGWRYPRDGAIAYAACLLAFSWGVPMIFEQLVVRPNELRLESPYIENCIRYTRMAYGLDRIEERDFPATDGIRKADLNENLATINSIPLWDRRPLMDTYGQLQEIRSYYNFPSVDVDRYVVNDAYRQVMLAAREFSVEQLALQGETWVNRHLVYTHGHGVVMSPANEIASDGLPSFYIKDIPPVSDLFDIERPEIYYGEDMRDYVIVRTKTQEFDYPRGDENVYTTYRGRGGVRLDSLFRRLAFALRFADPFLLVTNDLTQQSRILFDRHIGTRFGESGPRRFSKLAPFLQFDADPYLVVANGRLFWIQDAYTISNMFPYSEPYGRPYIRELNYMRNTVKVVMDAYDGSVEFYVWDDSDPIVRTFHAIFPNLFKDAGEMPESLRAHIRYPTDLFRAQTQLYNTYHMTSPQVYYNREDVWEPASEVYGIGERTREVSPYYIILRLPDGATEEFVLMQPVTPRGKDNMIAWLLARIDGPEYGRLIVYKMPKEKLIYGPMLIERRIDQDTDVSREITLWSQRGSDVIRGNLLIVPMGRSFVYVEPLYLRATQSGMPELKRVLAVNGEKVAMAENLIDALEATLDGAGPEVEASQPQVPETVDLRSLSAAALDAYREALALLRDGDFAAYGDRVKRLGETLEALHKETAREPRTD